MGERWVFFPKETPASEADPKHHLGLTKSAVSWNTDPALIQNDVVNKPCNTLSKG